MTLQQGRQRLGQARRLQRLLNGQQQGLVPVLRGVLLLAEEPGLDRRQRESGARLGVIDLGRLGRTGEVHGLLGPAADRRELEDLLGLELQALLLGTSDDLQTEDRVAADREEVVVGLQIGLFQNLPGNRQQALDPGPLRRLRHPCQGSHAGLGEQLLGGEGDLLLARAGNDLQAKNRVAALGEEVVIGADIRVAQQLAPDIQQGAFHGIQRLLGTRLDAAWRLLGQVQQCLTVDLAIGQQRHGLQAVPLRRLHIVRQACLQRGLDTRQVAIGSDQEGHQAVTGQRRWRVEHAYILDLRQRAQLRRHFRRLDAVAANLHLLVQAPEEQHPPQMIEAHPVARAVTLLTEARPIDLAGTQVTMRHGGALDIQLPADASRQYGAIRPTHADAHVAQGATERCVAVAFDLVGQHAHRGFTGPVVVDDTQLRAQGAHPCQQVAAQGFTAEYQALARQQALRLAGHQQGVEVRGHDLQHVHGLLPELRGQLLGIEGQRLVQQAQAPAAEQRAEQGGMAQIRGTTGQARQAGIAAQLQAFQAGADVVNEVALGHLHALGPSAGTRGVDHVGRQVRCHAGAQRCAAEQRLARHGQPLHLRWQPVWPSALTHADPGRGIQADILQTRLGPLRVEGQIGGATLPGGEHVHHQFAAARQAQGNPIAQRA
ncbi:hypothetical protein SRABI70_02627 [Pseudomonas sp. Bi70]|nr:hypothetical protein SRABI70_02627 [Pseudomonas sp. Bi70]